MTARHSLDQIVRGLDGVTAWLPKRRWEQMTAAEPWLTNIVYSEDQGKFFECVPLYSAEYVSELEARATAAEATVTALQEALERIASHGTVAGMHDQDKAGRLQEIARTALTTIRRTEK